MGDPVNDHRDALLMIDMQVGLVTGAWREAETLAVIRALIAQARAVSTPVIFIQHEGRGTAIAANQRAGRYPGLAPNAMT